MTHWGLSGQKQTNCHLYVFTVPQLNVHSVDFETNYFKIAISLTAVISINNVQCLCNDYKTERISFRCKFLFENSKVSQHFMARKFIVATG